MGKFKFSYVLIALAALAQGVMWINVFKMLHPGIWSYIGGIPAGLSIVGMVAKGANILPRVPSKRAREWGWALLVILMIAEPVVLGFANYSFMQPKSYVVAGGASLVVTLALVLGALVDRSLIPAEKQVQPKAKQKKQAVEQALPEFICSVCNYPASSQKALNGHMKKHKPKVTGYIAHFEPVSRKE